ncbi:hypothetical protein [Colwellia sp. MEBiC06753]
MIKQASWVLSLLVLCMLVVDFYPLSKNALDSTQSLSIDEFNIIGSIPSEKLDIEQRWLAVKEKDSLPKIDQTLPGELDGAQINLGGTSFKLLGIFNDKKAPFILIKGSANEMVKVSKGELIANSARLVALESDKVVFDLNDETIEFKLFENK